MCKNRYAGDLGLMPLDFNKKSLSFSSVPKTVVRNKVEKNEDEQYNVNNSNVNNYYSNSDKIKGFSY